MEYLRVLRPAVWGYVVWESLVFIDTLYLVRARGDEMGGWW